MVHCHTSDIYIYFTISLLGSKTIFFNCWCQELVGTFLTSKKLFDFNLRKEKQILMKFNIK